MLNCASIELIFCAFSKSHWNSFIGMTAEEDGFSHIKGDKIKNLCLRLFSSHNLGAET